MQDRESFLGKVLRARFRVGFVRHETFEKGFVSTVQVIRSSRFIFLEAGRVHYFIEGREAIIDEGTLIWVPASVHRVWRVSERQSARLFWVELGCPALDTAWSSLLLQRNVCRQSVVTSFERCRQLLEDNKRKNQLFIEAELKGLLGKFLREAVVLDDAWESSVPKNSIGERSLGEVITACQWLEAHYAEQHALRDLLETLHLNTAYFRKTFKEVTQLTPGNYLNRIRMRRARTLLSQGALGVKEVAANVGFGDALYFSRKYHQFWGCSPTQDRFAAKS